MHSSTVIQFQALGPSRAKASAAQPPSDAEIVQLLKGGDRRFGALLHDRVRRVVHATVHRVLGHADPEHDDVVQTSFEQIVRSLARGKYKATCSLTSWAAAVTTHVVLNVIRSRRTRRKYFDWGPTEVSPEPEREAWDERFTPLTERALIARRELALVRRQLAEMNPQRAEALLLHDVMEYRLAEMAELLGVSVAAVQSRLVRGRKELRARLEAVEGGAL